MNTPRPPSRTSFRIAIVLLLLVTLTRPASSRPNGSIKLPETPAGRRLGAWLQALNTGHPAAVRRFAVEQWKYENAAFPDEESARGRDLFGRTRGLRLRQVEAVPGGVRAIAQSKLSELWLEIKLFVDPEEPHRIQGFFLSFIDPPAELVPRTPLTDAEIASKTDALLTRLARADVFSGTVLVAHGDRAIYRGAFGLASRAWGMPNKIDTRFNLASITKMFTAVAVMQLAEQGKLSYQDPVARFLPDYPNGELARKVTIHHLLTHTSGLPGASTPAEYDKLVGAARHGFRKVSDYLPYFGAVTLTSEPGTRFEYSNFGYILLGAIVEKASGQDYYEYVRTHVFEPAGMNASGFYELDTEPRNIATGYMDAPDGARRSNLFSITVKGEPAGGAYSNARDLFKFAEALRKHTLISARSTERAWSNPGQAAAASYYGYGAEISRPGGLLSVGHGGGWFGITNRFELYPELGYTVIVLGNVDFEMGHIAQKLNEWLRQGRSK